MVYFIVGAVYVVLLVTVGVECLRKGHWVLFVVGTLVPPVWILGAVMPPARGWTR